MELKKIFNKKVRAVIGIFSFICFSLFSFTSTFAVTIVDTTNTGTQEAGQSLIQVILTWFFIGVFLFLLSFAVIILLAWIFMKIYNKLTLHRRKKSDFIYTMFRNDSYQCHVNRDTQMKKRNWKFLWIFWKRKPIYIKSKEGYEIIGYYDGECKKKEGYFCLALYNKLGMFEIFDQIILIPTKIKSQVFNKIDVGGQRVCVLDAEGVDEVGNTDYYLLPLIEFEKNKYVDFADEIHENYFEKRIYRDVIKENLISYRQNVISAVESNSNLHMKRRSK